MRSHCQEKMMNELEIVEQLRNEAKNYSPSFLAKRCKLTIFGIDSFVRGKHKGAQIRTVCSLADALGYEVHLVKKPDWSPLDTRPIVVPVVMKRTYETVKPENEFACLKCGRDAGVVEVAGHIQCAHCAHIVQDCCGD